MSHLEFKKFLSRRRSGLLSVAVGLLLNVAGPALADGLTPNDVAKIRGIRNAVVSPDGTAVAYTVSIPRRPFEDEDGPAWVELHVMKASGESRPFVFGEVGVRSVRWTADGKGVSFLAKRAGDEETCLYVIPVDGGEAKRLVEHETGISSYHFSADGQQVAFLATEKQPKQDEKLAKKGFKQEIFEEEGLFTRVFILDLEEEDAQARQLELEGSASELAWDPEGKRLSVALKPRPLVDQDLTSRKVHVVDAESGRVLAKFDNPGKLGPVRWSPDGKHLALVTALDEHDPSAGRLAVVPATGGALDYLLPQGYPGDVSDVVWLDDARLLASFSRGVEKGLMEVSLDGALKDRLAGGQACWSNFSLAADGDTVALVGSTPQHPGELYFGKLGGGVTRKTDSNPWLAERELGEQSAFSYTARDGETIEGILTLPLGFEEGQRYPLIAHIHGGPESHHCNGWLTAYSGPGQMAAARGFAVFAPNYRGSTGRGVAFAKAHQADPAGKEFDDIVDGVDHLIAKGLVDGDKVGITGGSYGGFASAWGATYYSERYAAAVMFVGISDHISKSGTTDIPDEITLVHQRKRVWEDWQFFLERSPVYYVKKAKTPILILHGKDDPRVNPGQSLELYRALKTLGQTPVRLIWYPGEGHGNRKAAARYDYSLRMLRWFEHYLQGEGGEAPDHELDYKAELGIEDEDENGE